MLRANPVDRIERRIGKEHGEVRKTSDYLTAADLATFLATAERVCPEEYSLVLVLATCGLRVGEAIGLQVGDLDVSGLRLHIRRAVRHGYIDSPKSGKAGVVDVPVERVAAAPPRVHCDHGGRLRAKSAADLMPVRTFCADAGACVRKTRRA